jgi:hypothetical protein
VVEDCFLDATKLAARLEPELLDEQLTDPLVDSERLGLAAATVESHHEVTPQAFAEGMLPHERLELPDDLAVMSVGKIGRNTGFEGCQVLLP